MEIRYIIQKKLQEIRHDGVTTSWKQNTTENKPQEKNNQEME